MLAAIELFKDQGTVDELGFGAVRDTISSVLFPGASVLHTRARYLLLVPWCVNQAVQRRLSPSESAAELRRLEIKVIYALLVNESRGVIGQQARDKVKRLPSAAYWSVLRTWGIRQSDTSIEGFFRDARVARQSAARQPTADDVGAGFDTYTGGFDPDLPMPSGDYLVQTTFTLTPEESAYIGDRLRMTTAGSLIPWLLDVGLADDVSNIWNHPAIGQAPPTLTALVEHGRRFSVLVHGAALLYNLLLAELVDDERGLVGRYRGCLDEWSAEVAETHALEGWERDEFWAAVRRHNPGLRRPTEKFVESWIERLRQAPTIADDEAARALIRDRELALKGGRARLVNAAARDHWEGASGLVRLDYNWSVAQRLLDDVLNPGAAA